MADIQVVLTDQYESKRELVEISDDVEIKSIIPLLIEQLELPLSDAGGRLNYKLIHKESGRQLLGNETLSSAGVNSGDTLRLVTEITAG